MLILASLQWGNYALAIPDVWDERNGLLWAEPFEKVNAPLVRVPRNETDAHHNLFVQAYHALEIVIMFQPSLGTFRFRVLTESLMLKKLSEYATSKVAR